MYICSIFERERVMFIIIDLLKDKNDILVNIMFSVYNVCFWKRMKREGSERREWEKEGIDLWYYFVMWNNLIDYVSLIIIVILWFIL